jgi:oligoribonuclease NrnB/cAMP/cGMP phosphodiesterase (DHH superfamily)
MTKPLVIYHAGCPDGVGAALVAYLKFGENALYYPGVYQQPFPIVEAIEAGGDIYCLDFSYPRDVLVKASDDHVMMRVLPGWAMAGVMPKGAERPNIYLIDHHKTAEAALKDLDYPGIHITFDMEHSGAVLAYRHFFPSHFPSHPLVPEMLLYLEDSSDTCEEDSWL